MKLENLTEQRRLHKCSACDKEFYWNEQSRWFGKVEGKNQIEEVEFKACSNECFVMVDERVSR